MRVLLVVPTRSDPAHRRVLAALRRGLAGAGDRVLAFPPRDGLGAAELRRRLERLLRDRRVELCHVQWFSRGLGWLGRARWPAGVRLVLTHQGASFSIMESFGSFRGLSRRADAVTCVSRQGLKEMLARLPSARGKACVIPNGTDPGGRARASRGRPFILCVGRLAAYKGIDLLLMAYAGLAREFPRLDLAVCGPDQSGGRLERFAARLGLGRRVRWLGEVRPGRVRGLMRECLFFVQPSRRENLPMALLEAMAEGKAVLACDVGGVGEVVRDGITGLVAPPQEPAGLEAAMRRLARDARLRRRLGRQARRSVRPYAWSAVAARYRALYRGLLGKGRAPGEPVQEGLRVF